MAELLYEGVGKRMPGGLDLRVDVRCRPDPVHAAGGDQMARAEFDPKRTSRIEFRPLTAGISLRFGCDNLL